MNSLYYTSLIHTYSFFLSFLSLFSFSFFLLLLLIPILLPHSFCSLYATSTLHFDILSYVASYFPFLFLSLFLFIPFCSFLVLSLFHFVPFYSSLSTFLFLSIPFFISFYSFHLPVGPGRGRSLPTQSPSHRLPPQSWNEGQALGRSG